MYQRRSRGRAFQGEGATCAEAQRHQGTLQRQQAAYVVGAKGKFKKRHVEKAAAGWWAFGRNLVFIPWAVEGC